MDMPQELKLMGNNITHFRWFGGEGYWHFCDVSVM